MALKIFAGPCAGPVPRQRKSFLWTPFLSLALAFTLPRPFLAEREVLWFQFPRFYSAGLCDREGSGGEGKL
jgi:hypothetical protein